MKTVVPVVVRGSLDEYFLYSLKRDGAIRGRRMKRVVRVGFNDFVLTEDEGQRNLIRKIVDRRVDAFLRGNKDHASVEVTHSLDWREWTVTVEDDVACQGPTR